MDLLTAVIVLIVLGLLGFIAGVESRTSLPSDRPWEHRS